MSRHLHFIPFSALCLCLSLPVSGQLLTSRDPNVLVFGGFTSAWTEVNGALWVGGDLNVAGYSVGKDLNDFAAGDPALVVGGPATWNNGQVFNGDAFFGGSTSLSGFNVPGGNIRSSLPDAFSFAALEAQALGMVSLFSSLPSTPGAGGIVVDGGSRRLEVTAQSGLNVLNLTAAQFAMVDTFRFNGPSDAQVIINISGSAYQHAVWTGVNPNDFSGGMGYSNLIFNFPEATSINLGTFSGFGGTLLAPGAHVTTAWGSMRGNMVAASYTGHTEFYTEFAPFFPDLPVNPVPEPRVIGLGAALFGLFFGLRGLRRRANFDKGNSN